MKTLTIKSLIQTVRELAEANPENVYTSNKGVCSYSSGVCSNNSVGCIFGQALTRFGIDVSQFDIKTTIQDDLCISTVLVKLGQKRSDWCEAVQAYQDKQYTWKEAIAYADATIVI